MEQKSDPKKVMLWIFIGMIFGAGVVGGVVWRLESVKAKKEAAGRVVAQQRSDELRSLTHLRSIGQALIIFARDNGDAFPPVESWQEDLLATGMIIPEMLVSRLDDGEGGDGVNYIFVSGPNSLSATQILAYEDPKHMADGVHVVFADTSAAKISHEEFERLLGEQGVGP